MYSEKPKRIAVIGAGAVGLSTAWQLTELIQKNNSNVSVTVLADKHTTETTSFGAAGIFRITSSLTRAPNVEDLKTYCADSWSVFDSIARSSESSQAGVSVISGYQLFREVQPLDDQIYKDLVYNFSVVQPQKLTFIPYADEFTQAFYFTTLLIECRRMLPWLTSRLLNRGVTFTKCFLNSLDEVSDKYDVVVNCTGLGSLRLVNDTKMFPVRGQLIKAKAPWIKTFLYEDDSTYIIPGIDHVSLGGCRQANNFNLNLDPRDSQDIRERCLRLAPSLAAATVDFEWVGLRPHREELRVSLESIRSATGREVPLVFNIGHGSNGVGLSMGTAKTAAKLAYSALGSNLAKL